VKLFRSTLSLVLCVLLSSCGIASNPNPIIDALQIVSDAANAAVIAAPLLQLTGLINGSQAAIIVSAAQNTATAAQASITEENSSDTNPVKIAAIVAAFSAVPLSISGLPPVAAALIQAIIAGVQQILALLHQPALTSLAANHPSVSASLMLTRYDKKRLKTIGAQNQETITKAKAFQAPIPTGH
jgi:hypothetical protein